MWEIKHQARVPSQNSKFKHNLDCIIKQISYGLLAFIHPDGPMDPQLHENWIRAFNRAGIHV